MGNETRTRFYVRGLTAALVLVAPETAAKESASAEAARLAKAGYEACTAGAPAEGIPKLEQAYALNTKPDIVFAIAVAYDQWDGHCAEAISTFQRYFAVCRGCKTLGVAKKRFARTKERCQARLVVEATPAGAKVEVDGDAKGQAPVTLRVTPGRHSVTVTADGHEPHSESVVAEAAKEQRLSVALARKRPAAPESTKVAAPPPAPSAPAESSPPEPPEPKPNPAEVPVRPTAATPEPAQEAPEPEPPDAAPPEDEGASGSLAVWALLGLGVAGLGTGATFTLLRSQELEAEEDPSISIDEVRQHRDAAQRNELVAYAGWGLGTVGLTAGVLMLWLGGDSAAEETRWSAVPVPGGLGMVCAF